MEAATELRSWRMSLARLQGQLMGGRAALGLKQTEVADRLGVSRSTFQRWEAGSDTTVPNMYQLFRWADVVGISITSAARVIPDASQEAQS